MEPVSRATWADIHGLVLGGLILLAFIGTLVGLWRVRPGPNAAKGVPRRVTVLRVSLGSLAAILWATVITGTWVVYPWYRAKLAGADFEKCQGLEVPSPVCSPRDFLLSNVSGDTETWHQLGMEWKEHIAWTAPFLATSAFLLALYYGPRIMARPWLRTAVIVMVVAAIGAATVGGGLGTFINKLAPVS
jgi:hypothetical protein